MSGIRKSGRTLLVAALAAFGLAPAGPAKPTFPPEVTVYKSATCGCCVQWIEHLRTHGFRVRGIDVVDVAAYRAKAGVPPRLGSCHTALVGGYVVEGHVPADVITRLLSEKPAIAGLVVPGMPIGSPGMEDGSRKDPYAVLALGRDGSTSVYDRR